jgi:hypothetical protein
LQFKDNPRKFTDVSVPIQRQPDLTLSARGFAGRTVEAPHRKFFVPLLFDENKRDTWTAG